MNMVEFQQVKDMTYKQYCDYLQKKYGIGLADYMTKSYNINPKCKRTKEGLIAHHKTEDKMVMLSNKVYAQMCPFEWQQKENIVYCDYLEHLLLHVLICKYPSSDKILDADVGIGGVVTFLVPELNDLYSGWETKQEWRKTCHNKVINDKDVYMEIIRMFLVYIQGRSHFNDTVLYSSFNESFGKWNREKNKSIYKEFNNIWKSLNRL